MAQKQYTTYQSDILSFELRDAMLGLLTPGRYCGYDTMAANGALSGSNQPIIITHGGTGVSKYDKQDPPVLEAVRGIALTTQGTIIAEDGGIALTVTFIGPSTGAIHKVYMEHAYEDSSPGVNPATYGIVSWPVGSAESALPNPTKNVVIGYIKQTANPTGIGSLTYYPMYPSFGDQDLYKKLFKTSVSEHFTEEGTDLGDGIVGDREYPGAFTTPFTSLTEAISNLDNALDSEQTTRIALGNRALDSVNWGALTDNSNQNASIDNHGLLRKLNGDPDTFLTGTGAWGKPLTRYMKHRGTSLPAGADMTYDVAGNSAQDFSLSSIITDDMVDMICIEITGRLISDPAPTQDVYIVVYHQGDATSSGLRFWLSHNYAIDTDFTTLLWIRNLGAPAITINRLNGTQSSISYLNFRVVAWQVQP